MQKKLERLQEMKKMARANLKAAQKSQQRNYDAKLRNLQTFKEGDHVWCLRKGYLQVARLNC